MKKQHKKRRLSLKGVRNVILAVGIALCIAGLVIPSDPSFAQRRHKPEWVMPSHYPEWFHGFGRIGLITDDRVVINDFNFRFSTYVEFHSPTEKNVSRSMFKEGMMVGFLMNEFEEIISMWLLGIK